MTWYIALFTTPSDADAIVGDLQEERLAIANRQGVGVARRWYLRQVLRTIAHLAIAPFTESPLTMLCIGILGFGFVLPLTRATDWLASQIVVPLSIYQHMPATTFWFAASVVPYLLIGMLSTLAGARRAMTNALSVCAVMALWVTAILPIRLVIAPPSDRLPTASEYLAHSLPALTIYGFAVLSAAALSVSWRHRQGGAATN